MMACSEMSGRRAQVPIVYTCALCETEDNVNWYCNDCEQEICRRCKEIHKRGRKTRNDDVVSINEASRQADLPVSEVCNIHPGKHSDMYCHTCKTMICNICLSQTHTQHNWTPFEDELETRKTNVKDHIKNISAKIVEIQNTTLTRDRANKSFRDHIDALRKDVKSRRNQLKTEVDKIANTLFVELRNLEEEETEMHTKNCQLSEKQVAALQVLLEKSERTFTSNASLFQIDEQQLLRSHVPLYDISAKSGFTKQPLFTSGYIDSAMLTKMMDVLQYEKVKVNSKHVQRLSTFTVTQQKLIHDICPVDNDQAWLVIHGYNGLVLVNKEGVVTETVIGMDFTPYRMAMPSPTEILMTQYISSGLVHTLSLPSKNVTTFADIKPHTPNDISIKDNGEVFVSTGTQAIVVLDQSGVWIKTITCGMNVWSLVCLTSERLAVSDRYTVCIVDHSGQTLRTWAGKLDNGTKVNDMYIYNLTTDTYERLFITDAINDQLYVLARDGNHGNHATCFLEDRHGVKNPTSVGVAKCGDVWVGCGGGTVHVMRL